MGTPANPDAARTYCAFCGQPLPAEARFCQRCGTPTATQEPPGTREADNIAVQDAPGGWGAPRGRHEASGEDGLRPSRPLPRLYTARRRRLPVLIGLGAALVAAAIVAIILVLRIAVPAVASGKFGLNGGGTPASQGGIPGRPPAVPAIVTSVSTSVVPASSAVPIITTVTSVAASTGEPSAVGPRGIVLKPGTTVTPTSLSTPPPLPHADLFANPAQPAYAPGKGFAPDAQRVLDVLSLQLSLERYKAAKGSYPPTLQALLPDFPPKEGGAVLSALPTDPETHQPYSYAAVDNGAGYQIAATTSTGQRYSGAPH